MADKNTAAFMLASREEGNYVNVYYAAPDTMEGAVLISSMRCDLLNAAPGLFKAWLDILRIAYQRKLNDAGITDGEWSVTPAPEHEKVGRA